MCFSKIMLLLAAGAFILCAQIQSVGTSGTIDWGKRVVVVTGIGAPPANVPMAAKRPNAMRAAWADAMRKALETVKGIRVSSQTTIENTMVKNDQINTDIMGYIKQFEQKGKERYFEDASIEITYEVAIDGEITEAVLPKTVTESPTVTSMPPVSAPKTVFTGLIIDCKGMKVTPAIAPKILDENNKEIYGSAYVSREWAVKYGMAGYAKTMEAAMKLTDWVGENPGMVKALRATGPNKTDVVLAKKDADSIRSATENLKFLSECRIILIID